MATGYTEVMGPQLRREVERQLLDDLGCYGCLGDGLEIEWWDACGEGHCTAVYDGALEEVSGLVVLDRGHNAVAEGWMDFIHGGGDNPLYVFWLFLSIREEGKWHKVKAEPTLPKHIWERLPEKTRDLCAQEGTYDARWVQDPRVRAWRRERTA